MLSQSERYSNWSQTRAFIPEMEYPDHVEDFLDVGPEGDNGTGGNGSHLQNWSDYYGDYYMGYEELSPSLLMFEKAVYYMNVLGIPILVFVGVVGNTLSLLVFMGTHLRLQSSSVYLAFLNIADTLFLLSLSVIWFAWLDIYLIHRPGWCQIVIYFSYVSGFLSVWTVVSFTVERYIVVFHPLKRHHWCSKKRAMIVLSCLTVGAFVFYSFSVWTTKIFNNQDEYICLPDPKFDKVLQILTNTDTIVTLALPSLAIILLNVGITFKIWEFVYRRREVLTASTTIDKTSFIKFAKVHNYKYYPGKQLAQASARRSRSSRSSGSSFQIHQFTFGRHSSQACARHSLQLRTTRTLVIVSSVFVVLNLPSHAFRIHASIAHMKNSTYIFPREVLLWQHVFQMLYYMNFAANFFLYFACSRTFRSAARRLFQRWKRYWLKIWNSQCCCAMELQVPMSSNRNLNLRFGNKAK